MQSEKVMCNTGRILIGKPLRGLLKRSKEIPGKIQISERSGINWSVGVGDGCQVELTGLGTDGLGSVGEGGAQDGAHACGLDLCADRGSVH